MTELEQKAEQAGRWYDACTGEKGTPEGRERHIKNALQLKTSNRPEPQPRAWSQAVIDTQPARRAQRKYKEQIEQLKAKANAPLRPAKIIDAEKGPLL